MATPIIKTIMELQLLSGGESCGPTLAMLEQHYPGWTLETEVDVLTWCEHLRNSGYPAAATHGFYRGLTPEQAKQFINWAFSKLLSYYSTELLIEVSSKLIEYINNPSDNLKTELSTYLNQLDHTHVVEGIFKAGIINAINNNINPESLQGLENALRRSGYQLHGINKIEIAGEALTKLEQIVGIRD